MKNDKLFSEIYSIDAATDCYMIEIGLDQYAAIFSAWDPAPFKRRYHLVFTLKQISFRDTERSGLAITGWVFLWEAVSLFAFTNRELYQRYRTYKRLHNAPVIFREFDNDRAVAQPA